MREGDSGPGVIRATKPRERRDESGLLDHLATFSRYLRVSLSSIIVTSVEPMQ